MSEDHRRIYFNPDLPAGAKLSQADACANALLWVFNGHPPELQHAILRLFVLNAMANFFIEGRGYPISIKPEEVQKVADAKRHWADVSRRFDEATKEGRTHDRPESIQ